MDHKTFFNNLADGWDTMCKHDQEKIQHICTHLGLKPGQHVLDVGTGTGVMLPFLRAGIGLDEGRLVAMDIAENMLSKAQEKFATIAEFVVADVMQLPFAVDTFDAIVCYSVFPHFSDKTQALQAMAKVLKRDGCILIAHSEGREHINSFHHGLNSFVSSDMLPEDEELIRYSVAAGLKAEFCENSPEMYVVRLTKL